MATDIERAFHTLALHPNALSWRTYRAHLTNYNIDGRIQAMRDAGQWPPRIVIADRWHDLGEFLRCCNDPHAASYALTLDNDALTVASASRSPLLR
jgi:hypothetical protein